MLDEPQRGFTEGKPRAQTRDHEQCTLSQHPWSSSCLTRAFVDPDRKEVAECETLRRQRRQPCALETRSGVIGLVSLYGLALRLADSDRLGAKFVAPTGRLPHDLAPSTALPEHA
jgi:hypothetical protein